MFRALGAAALAFGVASSPASALTFSFTTVSGDTLTTAQSQAFRAAANAWSSVLSDPFVVNLQVGFASLATGVLGSTSPTFAYGSASVIDAALAADAKDANDARAVASINALPPSGILTVTNAQAKALGFNQTGSDGSIQFSSNYTYSTSRNADGSIAGGTYDLIGLAEHEIGHLLGFDSGFDGGGATVLDLFRFTASGDRATSAASGYFSLDDGATSLAAFSPGPGDTYQASHWQQGTMSGGGTALMDPALSAGAVQNITPLDILALDVIGYDVIPVPAPGMAWVFLAGVLGVVGRRGRVWSARSSGA